jgi:hypothetical protein
VTASQCVKDDRRLPQFLCERAARLVLEFSCACDPPALLDALERFANCCLLAQSGEQINPA